MSVAVMIDEDAQVLLRVARELLPHAGCATHLLDDAQDLLDRLLWQAGSQAQLSADEGRLLGLAARQIAALGPEDPRLCAEPALVGAELGALVRRFGCRPVCRPADAAGTSLRTALGRRPA